MYEPECQECGLPEDQHGKIVGHPFKKRTSALTATAERATPAETANGYPRQFNSLMEDVADRMETVGRGLDSRHANLRHELFSKAWDLKTVARKGTMSEGL